MKKTLTLFVAIFYLSVASGFGMNLHYCMDKLVDWSLLQSNTEKCEFCGMNKSNTDKKDCCKDVAHSSKVDLAQKSSILAFNFEIPFFLVVQAELPSFIFHYNLQVQTLGIYSNAPPLGASYPLFIKNCTYRI